MAKEIQKKFLLSILVLLSFTSSCFSIDLDKLYPQEISQNFLENLKENPDKERAVFFHPVNSKKLIPLYLRYDKTRNALILRGNLSEKLDKLIQQSSFFGQTIFCGVKNDGNPLYQKGTTLLSSMSLANKKMASIMYVPHKVAKQKNDCFVCDLGYLEAVLPEVNKNLKNELQKLIELISGKSIRLARQVPLNRFYLFKETYFGPIHYFSSPSLAEAHNYSIFPPVHKLTMNKHVTDWKTKENHDRQLLFKIISQEEYLLSQDLRLKLGLVPGHVKLNWEKISSTDIGSGQNQVVFLSLGPGINYFDDPWQSERGNLPGPRLIFAREVLGKEEIQLFPTFSIEPKCSGEDRLAKINEFQSFYDENHCVTMRELLWTPQQAKSSLLKTIEKGLCHYNLINDSSDLRPGFSFTDQHFDGNIVNNEIRVFSGISLKALLCAVIVPPGTALDYQRSYARAIAGKTPHWQFSCANLYTNMFIEASTPDDKGFRVAWLKWQLRFSHPSLYRILDLARQRGNSKLELAFAEKISTMIQKEGPQFFRTSYSEQLSQLEEKKIELWCNYLEAFRENRNTAQVELTRFTNYYQYLVNQEKL